MGRRKEDGGTRVREEESEGGGKEGGGRRDEERREERSHSYLASLLALTNGSGHSEIRSGVVVTMCPPVCQEIWAHRLGRPRGHYPATGIENAPGYRWNTIN